MTTWALISCTKDKEKYACPAWEMYGASDLFTKAYAYAAQQGQTPLILSAKYGLLLPETAIEPYNETIIGKPKLERYQWAYRVWPDLRKLLKPGDTVVSYMGKVYEENLVTWLQEEDFHVERPLMGLGVGQRLKWFKERMQA